MRRSERIALWCVAVAAAAVIWIPRYPPMIDLPQHAGQIRWLHDWFASDFSWRRQLELNWFTPYVIGYTVAALLTCVMPAVFATKLVWSLAMLGTLHATRRVRARLGGDPRWDWLVLPGLFGIAFMWGMFPFMIAVPLALYVLERWLVYLRAPSVRGAALVSVLFAAMFFAHLLATAWLLSVAGIALLGTAIAERWRIDRVILRGLPLLVPLPIGEAWWHIPKLQMPPGGTLFAWELGWNRITDLFPQLLGVTGSSVAIAVGALLYALPFVCGARLSRSAVALAPLAVTALILAIVPNIAFGNAWTYNRFYILLGPSLVIALAPASRETARLVRLRVLVPLLAAAWVALMGVRMALFARESADFVELVARMPPHQRVLGVVFARRSVAADLSRAYLHYPVWYQAEGGGFVDHSFATLPASMLLVRSDYRDPILPGFEFAPSVDWKDPRMLEFDTFLVRVPDAEDPKPPLAIPQLRLVDHEGTWWRYDVVGGRGAGS